MVIVLLAAVLRVVKLAENPPGLFRDELDKGYTALCLLEMGCDQTGAPWPLFVRALKVTTSAVYEYLTFALVAMFGLSETVIRFPAALAGILSVLVTIQLGRKLWGDVPGLVAGVLLACSPWHLLLSRWANQSILLTLWIPLAALLWMLARNAVGARRWAFLIGSGVSFALALYTYVPARMVVPLLCVTLAAIEFLSSPAERRARLLVDVSVIGAIIIGLCIPLARHVLTESESGTRLAAITVFDGRPWHAVLQNILSNYVSHFSPMFLLLGGDSNPRHSIGFPGACHLVTVVGVVLGLWRAVRTRERATMLVAAWLLLGPAAAACTNEGLPHALRAIMMLPALQLLASAGMVEAQERWGAFVRQARSPVTSAVTGGTVVLFAASLVFWYWSFWAAYPANSALWWEPGRRALVEWYVQNKQRYPRMIVSGHVEYPQPAFLVYGGIDPRTWIETREIPDIEFLPVDGSIRHAYRADARGVAYAVRPGELNVRPVEVIRHPSGDADWLIVGEPLEAQ